MLLAAVVETLAMEMNCHRSAHRFGRERKNYFDSQKCCFRYKYTWISIVSHIASIEFDRNSLSLACTFFVLFFILLLLRQLLMLLLLFINCIIKIIHISFIIISKVVINFASVCVIASALDWQTPSVLCIRATICSG